MPLGHFWVQAFDLAQQTAICWRPLWTVRGKPLPLPAVKLKGIIANTGRTKQAENGQVRISGKGKTLRTNVKQLVYHFIDLRIPFRELVKSNADIESVGDPIPVPNDAIDGCSSFVS